MPCHFLRQTARPGRIHHWPKKATANSQILEASPNLPKSPQEVAWHVAWHLLAFVAECDQYVTLRLVAPTGNLYSGREVWDVMLCLGLDYGDGDLFHWINNSGFGDDLFFSVWTSTAPGYFIPNRMATGEGDVEISSSDSLSHARLTRQPSSIRWQMLRNTLRSDWVAR